MIKSKKVEFSYIVYTPLHGHGIQYPASLALTPGAQSRLIVAHLTSVVAALTPFCAPNFFLLHNVVVVAVVELFVRLIIRFCCLNSREISQTGAPLKNCLGGWPIQYRKLTW